MRIALRANRTDQRSGSQRLIKGNRAAEMGPIKPLIASAGENQGAADGEPSRGSGGPE